MSEISGEDNLRGMFESIQQAAELLLEEADGDFDISDVEFYATDDGGFALRISEASVRHDLAENVVKEARE